MLSLHFIEYLSNTTNDHRLVKKWGLDPMKYCIKNMGANQILYLYEPIDMKFSQMSDT